MSNPEWGGPGVLENDTNRQQKYGGVTIGGGEVGISVMWYGKINIASSALDYYVSRSSTKSIIQNNNNGYFLRGGLEMYTVVGSSISLLEQMTTYRNKRRIINGMRERVA